MPGGKIVFYTGIMPICQNDAGVAVVMGHEVAHALLDHGAERMSKGTLQQAGAGILAIGTELAGTDRQNAQLFMQAYGVGTSLGMLKYSRDHEREADKVGLYLTAIAGYNPAEAPELWRRMKAASGGQAPPQFFSTHPSTDERIETLTELVPEAKAEAKKYGITEFK
jgi:predicted Zn-dependent protease